MANGPDARRLADLLIELRETPEVEVKNWIDIRANDEHKALLAKALIALANHGGGYVVIGFQRGGTGMEAAAGRPADLSGYTTDAVNAVVARFAEPVFHCDVRVVARQGGADTHPVIVVPGGHRAPIRAKRNGPNNQGIQNGVYYIRRPGPQSEAPQSGQEWDMLLQRCLRNARDDLLDSIRGVLAGTGGTPPEPTVEQRLGEWFAAAQTRWRELRDTLPADHPSRMPMGHYAVGYNILGVPQRLEGAALLTALRRGEVRHTGWPPFWVPDRDGIRPYPHNGNVECWLGRDDEHNDRTPAHSDFWVAAPDGKLFLQRGYQEDSREIPRYQAGTWFDLTLPIWRMGEVMLHAASMAQQFNAADADIAYRAEWAGLRGRALVGREDRLLWIGRNHVCHQDQFQTTLVVSAAQIRDALPEVLHRLLTPLYAVFDFFELPLGLVTEELARMRAHRF